MLLIAPHGMRSARRRGQVGGVPPPPVLWRVQNETGGGRTPGLPPRLPGADGGQGGPPHLCRCEGEPRTWPSRGPGTPGLRPPPHPRSAFAQRPEPRAGAGWPGGVSARLGPPRPRTWAETPRLRPGLERLRPELRGHVRLGARSGRSRSYGRSSVTAPRLSPTGSASPRASPGCPSAPRAQDTRLLGARRPASRRLGFGAGRSVCTASGALVTLGIAPTPAGLLSRCARWPCWE